MSQPASPAPRDPLALQVQRSGTPTPAPASANVDPAVVAKIRSLESLIERQSLQIESLQDRFAEMKEKSVVAAPLVSAVAGGAPIPTGGIFDESFLYCPKPLGMKFQLEDLLRVVIKHQASDLHLKVGAPATVRLHGDLVPIGDQPLTEEQCRYLVFEAVPENKRLAFLRSGEVDHAHVALGVRFRLNAFLERGRLSAAFRMVRANIPEFEHLGLPAVLTRLASYNNGLVLVTGPAGCGKSTTLACMVDWINRNRKVHVVTIEDPIEYYHDDKSSYITQREVGTDTTGFVEALRQALRQDPNVILVGEMRDVETIFTAVTAAETGHLVLSTLHTPNAIQAIDRILDTFSGDQQKQIRMLLASCLRGVVSQKLLARADGKGRVPAVEVLVCTPTISSFIATGETKEIYPFVQQGAHEGMQTFNDSLRRLLERGIVTKEEAMFHAEQLTELRLSTRHIPQSGAGGPSNILGHL